MSRLSLIVVAFITPIIGFVYMIKSFNWFTSKTAGIFLCFLFGMSLNFSSDTDIYRHLEMVKNVYAEMSLSQFLEYFFKMLTFNLTETIGLRGDLYIHVLSYFTGAVLHQPSLFLGFSAMVYGYFFLSSLELLFKPSDAYKGSRIFLLLFIYFISLRFLENFQTIRTWTGMWVLTYGALRYFSGAGRKYLIFILITPAFHLAYGIMAIPVLSLVVLKRLPNYFFIIVCFLSTVMSSKTFGLAETLGSNEQIEQRAGVYFISAEESSVRAEKLLSDTNFYKRFSNVSLVNSSYVVYFVIIILGHYNQKAMNSLEYSFFSSSLLMLSLSNVSLEIYALHNRTAIISAVFAFVALISLVRRGEFTISGSFFSDLIRRGSLIIILIIGIPYFLFTISNVLNLMSWSFVAFPVLTIFFPEINMSVRDIISYLLG